MKQSICIVAGLVGVLGLFAMAGCPSDTTYDCDDRTDCADNWGCVEGICDCDPGYSGIHCSTCNIVGGYVSDGAGGCVPATCDDLDGDGYDGHDEAVCPLGTDHCDDNADNWTPGGCTDCVDADGDGHGANCNLGPDCDDADDTIFEGCNACIDNDGDGHGVNCSDGPDCNDNDETVHRGCFRVWYWGDFDTNGTFEVASQFYPGAARSTLSLTGINTSDQLNGVAVSPDGALVAVAAFDASGFAVLNLYTTDATTTPLTLASGTTGQQIAMPSFSPDGNWVAFTWDADGSSFALYAVPVTGGTPQVVSPAPGAADCDVTYYRWAPSQGGNQHIAFVGDVDTDGQFALWGVEASSASPAAVEIVATAEATDLGVQPLLGFDNANRVYFRSDFEVMGTDRLYRANLDGSGREQVPGTALINGGGESSVGGFGLNDSGTLLAVAIDAPAAGLYQVYVVDVATGNPDRVSNVTSTPPSAGDFSGPGLLDPIVWDPEDDYLAVISDWASDASDMDDAYALYLLPALNNGGERLVGVPSNAAQDVQTVAFAPSGQQIFLTGDLVANDNSELFLTNNIWSVDVDPASIRIEDVPTGGDVIGFYVVLIP